MHLGREAKKRVGWGGKGKISTLVVDALALPKRQGQSEAIEALSSLDRRSVGLHRQGIPAYPSVLSGLDTSLHFNQPFEQQYGGRDLYTTGRTTNVIIGSGQSFDDCSTHNITYITYTREYTKLPLAVD